MGQAERYLNELEDLRLEHLVVGTKVTHCKGGRYRIIGVGRHTDTTELYVIYCHEKAEDGELFHVRPLNEFLAYTAWRDGIFDYRGPRFQHGWLSDLPSE